jgi:hypothetical protein
MRKEFADLATEGGRLHWLERERRKEVKFGTTIKHPENWARGTTLLRLSRRDAMRILDSDCGEANTTHFQESS